MFFAVSIFCLLWPLAALMAEDKPVTEEIKNAENASVNSRWLTGGISLLLLASLIATIAVFVNILGRSLTMNNLNFSATAIASTGAVGGAIALPLPVLLGWLSDRIGRKLLLIVCYLAGLLSMLILAISTSLWHFWIATPLITVLFDVNRGIGSIYFMKDGVDIPANVEVSGNARLYFPASKFEEIMNVLRHEEPLYIALVPSNGIGTISTSSEPIGEEEKD